MLTTLKWQSNSKNNSTIYFHVESSYSVNGTQTNQPCSNKSVRESQEVHPISDVKEYTKTLGLEWNTSKDQFHLTVASLPTQQNITKRLLVSEVAKLFDVLGWFSPAVIKATYSDSRLIGMIPCLLDVWTQWRLDLPSLSNKHIPRCYYPKEASVVSTQLHGFSDASENAYAGVVYLRMIDSRAHISCYLKNKGRSDQTTNDSTFGAVWCTVTSPNTSTHKGIASHLNE